MKTKNVFRSVAIILCILATVKINAQMAPNIFWEQNYNSGDDWALDVKRLSNGNYVNVGFASIGGVTYPSIRLYSSTGAFIAENHPGTTKGYFSEVIQNNALQIVTIGKQQISGIDQCIMAKYDATTLAQIGSTYVVPITSSNTNAGKSLIECLSCNPLNPTYYICGATSNDLWVTTKGFVATVVDVSGTLTYTSDFKIPQTGNSTAYHITAAPANQYSATDGFAICGYVTNSATPPTNDVYVARFNNNATTPNWQLIVDSKTLPGANYTKKDNSIGPCPPAIPSNNDWAEYITCTNGEFVVSALFNKTEIYATCNGDTYKDADGVLIKITDCLLCVPTPTTVTYNNIAHFSGYDFQFKTKVDVDGKYVSIGTSQDAVWTGGEERAYLIKSDMSNTIWRKFIRSTNGNTGVCGFGLDFAADNGYIVCGNNEANGDDAIMDLMSCDCNSSVTIPNEPITTATWNSSAVKNGTVTVSGILTINNTATISFKLPCGKISGYVVLDNHAVLKPVDGFENYFTGVAPNGYLFSMSNYSRIEKARIGVNNGRVTINSNATFKNCEVATYMGHVYTNNIADTYFTTDIDYPLFFNAPIGISLVGGTTTVTTCHFTNTKTGLEPRGIVKNGGIQLTVQSSTFDKIGKGIYTSGSSMDRINNNLFTNIPQPAWVTIGGGGLLMGQSFAIQTVGSSAAHIEGNNITGTGASSMNPIYAIIQDNSTTNGNLVFKNTMSNTYTGLQVQGTTNSNLIVSCNNFNGYAYSFTNAKYAWYVANGSFRNQGTGCTAGTGFGSPAGNEWSAGCTSGSAVDIKVAAVVTPSVWTYTAHTKDILGTELTQPKCRTSAKVSLNPCGSGSVGYQKTASSCNVPFDNCTNCHLAPGTPPMVGSFNYYRDLSDASEQSWLASNGADAQAHADLVSARGMMMQVENELVGDYLSNGQVVEAEAVLASSIFPYAKRMLTERYFWQGKYQKVRDAFHNNANQHRSLTNQYYQDSTSQAAEAAEQAAYEQYMGTLINAAEQGRTANRLLPYEVDEMRNLVVTNTAYGVHAENVITLNTGEQFEHGVLLPDDTAEPEPSFKTTDIIELSPENPVKVYPVPANNVVNFDVLVTGTAESKLQITDVAGKLLALLPLNIEYNKINFSTEQLATGVYFYAIINNKKISSQGKFSIIK